MHLSYLPTVLRLTLACTQIFAQGAPFDYGVTLSDAVDMPVNLGMQFVARGRYLNAIGFLNDVIAIYPFNETFIAGQVGSLTHPHAWQWCILPAFLCLELIVPSATAACLQELIFAAMWR